MNFKFQILILIFTIFFISESKSQKSINDSSITFSFVGINYGYMIPGGDLVKRFGNNSEVGLSYSIKLKNKWTIGLDGQFIFARKVKENHILDEITSTNNTIIGVDGNYADIRFFERGYHFTANLGRIFSFKKPNPNSGIWITAGAGFLQHKIRIENIGNTVPELTKQYLKGYDRLTNGFELREFIGYAYFGRKRLINIYAGFEFIQAFTKCRRDYNFDTRTHESNNRIDLLNGLRIGWLLPLYKRPPEKFYLY
jgi:hypothetical protein